MNIQLTDLPFFDSGNLSTSEDLSSSSSSNHSTADVISSLKVLIADLERKTQGADELENRIIELTASNEDLLNKLALKTEEAATKVLNLENTIKDVTDQRDEFQEKAKITDEKNVEIKKESERLKREVDSMREELSQLLNKISQLESENGELAKSLNEKLVDLVLGVQAQDLLYELKAQNVGKVWQKLVGLREILQSKLSQEGPDLENVQNAKAKQCKISEMVAELDSLIGRLPNLEELEGRLAMFQGSIRDLNSLNLLPDSELNRLTQYLGTESQKLREELKNFKVLNQPELILLFDSLRSRLIVSQLQQILGQLQDFESDQVALILKDLETLINELQVQVANFTPTAHAVTNLSDSQGSNTQAQPPTASSNCVVS